MGTRQNVLVSLLAPLLLLCAAPAATAQTANAFDGLDVDQRVYDLTGSSLTADEVAGRHVPVVGCVPDLQPAGAAPPAAPDLSRSGGRGPPSGARAARA